MTAMLAPEKIEYQPGNKSVWIDPTLKLRPKTLDAALESLIGYGYPFSADDVHDMVPAAGRNAIGRKFAQLNTEGRIRRIGDLRSTTKSRKGGRISLWISSAVVESRFAVGGADVPAPAEMPPLPKDPWA
ncbi:hypothetical protein SEA_MOLLYMUR_78 [Gordonia phage Mollymur]|uniref:Uncharacterized protein n=1 Tax=Gordonia phage Mollymur TaxID=2590895 RepID=A0A4Y6EA24_9CAUD|nr:hypothetical protein PQB84_gp048 [Gordonia phage Mollymur]QDF15438.1 hypothetical protein SEA_MOLLYMUR_78 [Gordonia phage Mollymur]